MTSSHQSDRVDHSDRIVFLDTETTGLNPPRDKIVELAVLDDTGTVLLSTLVNPERDIPQRVVHIHGITTAMVSKAPTFEVVLPRLEAIFQGAERVVVYNAEFDIKFLPENLVDPQKVSCCMRRFIHIYEELEGHFSSKRFPLAKAYHLVSGNQIRHLGPEHRAVSDCLACWHVWRWCDEKEPLLTTPSGRGRGSRAYCSNCQRETFFKFRPRYREGYNQYYQCTGCFENNVSIAEMDELKRGSGGKDA
jgi:DNA polymerase-3 subunit epsilon